MSVSGGGGQLALTDIEVQGSAHAGIHAFILKKGLFSPLVFDIAVWTAAQWHLGATVVGATVVVVTHELASIFAIGNNSVFLDAETRTMIASGNPADLLTECEEPRVIEFLTRGERAGVKGAHR